MKTVAVIMAGGKGERFWPRSRSNYPKQFLSLTSDNKTMIQLTVERIASIVNIEDVFVVTNKNYIDLVKAQLPNMPVENILAEPMAKNTAPCIGYAGAVISRKYEDAVMLVLPSDHLIYNKELYLDTLNKAIKIAQEGSNLVTLGITPMYPETGYGYINFAKDEKCSDYAYRVNRFVEKPNEALAKKYIQEGTYLWNSGMFVWKASTINQMFQRYLPEAYKSLLKIKESFQTAQYEKVLLESYADLKSESIDYAIMERADNIYTIPGNFGWDDVGSWLALERFNAKDEFGNVLLGESFQIDSKNNIIYGSGKKVALVGIEDSVIVQTDDVILVCAKNDVNKIKDMVHLLKANMHEELL